VNVAGTIRHLSRSGARDVLKNLIRLPPLFGATRDFSGTKRESLMVGDPKICGANGNPYRVKCGIENRAIRRARCLLPLILREILLSLFAGRFQSVTLSNRGYFLNKGLRVRRDGKRGAV
jgi:hypothetical protein